MSKTTLTNLRSEILSKSRAQIADFLNGLTNDESRYLLASLVYELKRESGNELAESFDFARFALACSNRSY